MTKLISSTSNLIIKQARSLHQKKARDESGLFLVEGILHVGAAVEAGWDFDVLLYCPDKLKSEFGWKLVETLNRKGVLCQPVTETVFASFAEKENPQGLAGLVRKKIFGLADFPTFNFSVAMVTPQDPGNMGTILRTLDGAGGDGLILLDGGVDTYHPSCVRASMGSIFYKPFCFAAFSEFVPWVKNGGVRLISTSAHATVDYRQIRLDSRPTILMLGSEQKGLLPEQLAISDELISLPMRGKATSLNLAVAAGVFLYTLKG